LDPKGEEFSKLKERILLLERVILHTIGFELSIDHPYKFFVEQIKKLIHNRQIKYKVAPPSNVNTSQVMTKKMLNELVQYSMSCANDSMHTSLCLQFSPQLIATACVYLACQFAKVEATNGDWKKILGDPDVDSLASICIQICELVADRKASDTDTFKKIKAQLELLKSREDGAGSKSPLPPPPPPPPASSAEQPNAKRPRVG
jgi:cyclin T